MQICMVITILYETMVDQLMCISLSSISWVSEAVLYLGRWDSCVLRDEGHECFPDAVWMWLADGYVVSICTAMDHYIILRSLKVEVIPVLIKFIYAEIQLHTNTCCYHTAYYNNLIKSVIEGV